ncbi:hypothetical protein KKE92_03880 [Candidatus Micrarchaeota archaeon]|nr:hypothetical protein [Candidatus Micrarchaeota archaeon]
MQRKIHTVLGRLSSKKALERKAAIKEMVALISHEDAHLARLSLHYVSVHDPSFTVRNLARQAFYRIGEPPSNEIVWDKSYRF